MFKFLYHFLLSLFIASSFGSVLFGMECKKLNDNYFLAKKGNKAAVYELPTQRRVCEFQGCKEVVPCQANMLRVVYANNFVGLYDLENDAKELFRLSNIAGFKITKCGKYIFLALNCAGGFSIKLYALSGTISPENFICNMKNVKSCDWYETDSESYLTILFSDRSLKTFHFDWSRHSFSMMNVVLEKEGVETFFVEQQTGVVIKNKVNSSVIKGYDLHNECKKVFALKNIKKYKTYRRKNRLFLFAWFTDGRIALYDASINNQTEPLFASKGSNVSIVENEQYFGLKTNKAQIYFDADNKRLIVLPIFVRAFKLSEDGNYILYVSRTNNGFFVRLIETKKGKNKGFFQEEIALGKEDVCAVKAVDKDTAFDLKMHNNRNYCDIIVGDDIHLFDLSKKRFLVKLHSIADYELKKNKLVLFDKQKKKIGKINFALFSSLESRPSKRKRTRRDEKKVVLIRPLKKRKIVESSTEETDEDEKNVDAISEVSLEIGEDESVGDNSSENLFRLPFKKRMFQ